jgi:hypothetical protein
MKFALASAALAAFTLGLFTPAVAEQGKAATAGPSTTRLSTRAPSR